MKEDTNIHQQFNIAKTLGVNFAAIRLPGTTDVYYFYASAAPEMIRVKYEVVDQPLFFCSPYGAGNKAYALKAEAVFKNSVCIYGSLPNAVGTLNHWHEGGNSTNFMADEAFYVDYVRQIVAQIEAGTIDKAVAARCVSVDFTSPQQVDVMFETACEQYPDACVCFYSIQGIGSWFTATPEQLISTGNNTLQTVALAGTLPIDSTQEWTAKEQDEQGMIEFFIHGVFRENGFKKINIGEVETIAAGNVKHLRSAFKVHSNDVILTSKFHHVLEGLNPTPAVCGLPQLEASLLIASKEHLERRFYSGFIGIHLPKTTLELFVNLRCAELFKDKALLYAGAGITGQSIAESEFAETEKKLQTIQSLFHP